MAVGQKKKILMITIHTELRIVLQDRKVKRRKKIRATQRPPRVAAGGAMHHSEDIPPDLCSNCFQINHISGVFRNSGGKANGNFMTIADQNEPFANGAGPIFAYYRQF